MTKRLSDDEKRYFTDKISLLKGENERLTKCVEDLQTENKRVCKELAQEEMRIAGFLRHLIGEAFDFMMPKSERNETLKTAIDHLGALLTGEDEKD